MARDESSREVGMQRPWYQFWMDWGLVPRLMATVGIAVVAGGVLQSSLLVIEGAAEHNARLEREMKEFLNYLAPVVADQALTGDYAAIEVIELPTLEQVGEWHHNMTPVQSQARILRDMIKYVEEQFLAVGLTASIYYSVENNSVGDAALVSINELGEETFPGLFLSEPIKKGHVRRFRKGFNTTHSAKISACSKLKQLIETKQFKIKSKSLISELKTFVAQGITFKAKTGQNDDLVSSILLAVRMIMLLQDWDPSIYEKMRDHTGLEEHDLPLPVYISTF